MTSSPTIRIGVDIGGTFTDVALEIGEPCLTAKILTTTTLNKETNAALADPMIKARLADFGGRALVGSPADFGRLIVEETEKWAKVVKFANIKVE